MYQRLSAHLTSVELLSDLRESASRISSNPSVDQDVSSQQNSTISASGKFDKLKVDLRFYSSKVEFVRSFFGRNIDLKKSFRLCLTFSWYRLLFFIRHHYQPNHFCANLCIKKNNNRNYIKKWPKLLRLHSAFTFHTHLIFWEIF